MLKHKNTSHSCFSVTGTHFQRLTEKAAGLNRFWLNQDGERRNQCISCCHPSLQLLDSPKIGPERPGRHHLAPLLAPGSSTTSCVIWGMSPCTARTALQLSPPQSCKQSVLFCPPCLDSPQVFSKSFIWLSYIATEATSILAHHGSGDLVNSGSLFSLSCT